MSIRVQFVCRVFQIKSISTNVKYKKRWGGVHVTEVAFLWDK